MPRNRGLTIIEITVAGALFMVLFVVVWSSLAQGTQRENVVHLAEALKGARHVRELVCRDAAALDPSLGEAAVTTSADGFVLHCARPSSTEPQVLQETITYRLVPAGEATYYVERDGRRIRGASLTFAAVARFQCAGMSWFRLDAGYCDGFVRGAERRRRFEFHRSFVVPMTTQPEPAATSMIIDYRTSPPS